MGLSYGAPCAGCGKELGRAKHKGKELCKSCRPLTEPLWAETEKYEAFPGFIIADESAKKVAVEEKDPHKQSTLRRIFKYLWR